MIIYIYMWNGIFLFSLVCLIFTRDSIIEHILTIEERQYIRSHNLICDNEWRVSIIVKLKIDLIRIVTDQMYDYDLSYLIHQFIKVFLEN